MQGISTLNHSFTATIASIVVGHFSNRELAVYSLAVSEHRGRARVLKINGKVVPQGELDDALENYAKPEIQEIREAAHA